jgi:hypothetical protein
MRNLRLRLEEKIRNSRLLPRRRENIYKKKKKKEKEKEKRNTILLHCGLFFYCKDILFF